MDAERETSGGSTTNLPASANRAGTGSNAARHLERVSSAESDTTLLLHKLFQWLIQQPEWVRLLAAPRMERKQAAKLMADLMFRIPKVQPGENWVPRSFIRTMTRLMEKGGEG